MKIMKKISAIALSMVIAASGLFTGSTAASAESPRKLDLAFVIDSTASMACDIDNIKDNIQSYLDKLEETGEDFRIAIVDYRDFPDRGKEYDYPYKVELDFTSDCTDISMMFGCLDRGNGGDYNETVYSALIDGLNELSWRNDAGKAAILIGDAPALDPEPYTGYTYDDAVKALNGTGTEFAETTSDGITRSPITLFTIATITHTELIENFKNLSEDTNGKAYLADKSSDIPDIICEIIEAIPEMVETPAVAEEDKQETSLDPIRSFFSQLFSFFMSFFSKLKLI